VVTGYLTKYKDGLYGQRGTYYDYVLASNGIFVEAENALLAARVPVAYAEIRGLALEQPAVVLRHGLIPSHLLDLALGVMQTDLEHECFVAVTCEEDGQYRLKVPHQMSDGARVAYEKSDHTLLELHSHLSMKAFFSVTDDKDERGFKLFGVIGRLPKPGEPKAQLPTRPRLPKPGEPQTLPQIRLRVGLYGYFHEIPCEQVFHGTAPVIDCFGQEGDIDVPSGH